jgi:type IV secretion system protein VirB10
VKPSPVSPAPPTDPATPNDPAVTAPVAPGGKLELPVGTRLPLVLHNGITTRIAKPGDPVYLETLFPVIVDGKIMVPAGSYVSGEVTEAKRAGRVKGRAEINLRLKVLILPNGYIVNFAGAPAGAGTGGGETMDNEGKIKGDSDKASDAGTLAKTTAAGAGIGGIAGGVKGLGIGAGTGAALGLAAVLLSRGPDAQLPRGTTLDAVLDRPIFLDADKIQFTDPGHASTLPGPANREPERNHVPF